jgi:rRNA maturation protein Nop10
MVDEAKRIDSKTLVQDIRSGMHPMSIMKRHGLSPSRLKKCCQALLRADLLEESDLDLVFPPENDGKERLYTCPNCGTSQTMEFEECPQCGVIVSKVPRAPQIEERHVHRAVSEEKTGTSRRQLFAIALAVLGFIVVVTIGSVIRTAKRTQAFLQACHEGNVSRVEDFLEERYDVNVNDDNGRTCLMFAAAGGHADVVKLLLDNGADVDSRNRHNWTPLMKASSLGREKVVELLLLAGADVNAKGALDWTPLIAASHHGHAAVVELLLEYGADVNAQSTLGWTAAIAAGRNWHEGVMEILEAHQAKLRSRSP